MIYDALINDKFWAKKLLKMIKNFPCKYTMSFGDNDKAHDVLMIGLIDWLKQTKI